MTERCCATIDPQKLAAVPFAAFAWRAFSGLEDWESKGYTHEIKRFFLSLNSRADV